MISQYRRNRKTLLYILFDLFFSFIAWTIIYRLRLYIIEQNPSRNNIITTIDNINLFSLSFYAVPTIWIFLFFFFGDYKNIYHRSRLYEISTLTYKISIGAFIVFILFIVNDITYSEIYFITIFFSYFIVQYLLIALGRLFVLNTIKNEISKKIVQYNTIVISDDPKKALDFITKEKKINLEKIGINIMGYFLTNRTLDSNENVPKIFLGYFDDFYTITKNIEIDIAIINLFSIKRDDIQRIINTLDEKNIEVKVVPNIIDIASGSVKADNVLGLSLVNITINHIPEWEQFIKRFFDIIMSTIGLTILSPLLLYIALRVKLSSQGPIIYKQERIGYKEKPFIIFKFRSMHTSSETNGPQLTRQNDTRITKWGKVMRKWRLDELPQLWNVVIGNMSFVGPRPERKFFLDQLASRNQYSKIMFRVKPGVTSLGMVKFGYATNVDEISARMKYDLIYIENTSILLDFSILFLTISTILKGKGK